MQNNLKTSFALSEQLLFFGFVFYILTRVRNVLIKQIANQTNWLLRETTVANNF